MYQIEIDRSSENYLNDVSISIFSKQEKINKKNEYKQFQKLRDEVISHLFIIKHHQSKLNQIINHQFSQH